MDFLGAILAAVVGAIAGVVASRIDRALEKRKQQSEAIGALANVLLDEVSANIRLVEGLLSQEELVTPRDVQFRTSDMAWTAHRPELQRLDPQLAGVVSKAYRELGDLVRRLEHLTLDADLGELARSFLDASYRAEAALKDRSSGGKPR